MGADTDFNALYRELGVTADCDFGQFRQAYRRRVGSLHPDHLGTDGGLARLQQLNQSYARAAEFHRLHGRLPGAAKTDGGRALFEFEPESVSGPAPVAGKRHRARYSVLVALVTVLLLWLHDTIFAGPRVTLGMSAEDVHAVQGEPSTVIGPRWGYGPSWIEFHCGKVVDWYSAPQEPLRVDDEASPRGKPLSSEHMFDC